MKTFAKRCLLLLVLMGVVGVSAAATAEVHNNTNCLCQRDAATWKFKCRINVDGTIVGQKIWIYDRSGDLTPLDLQQSGQAPIFQKSYPSIEVYTEDQIFPAMYSGAKQNVVYSVITEDHEYFQGLTISPASDVSGICR